MKFISICSGIEAASVAFEPLGWKAIAFSEIEPFPCAVLAHHYPDVTNFGDMTNFKSWPEEIFEEADVIVGGPPCQAFSVAGLRNGLDDSRGNLTLIYAEIINYADAIRIRHGKPPVIVLYENVPGLLSDKTNAFGCFLAGLAGEDLPLEPPGEKWTNAGVVLGSQRAIAWRVTDAQYFGVPQRRRRVFVVASARDGFDPAEIFFEFDGVRRDIAPSREKREEITHDIAPCLTSSGRGVERAGDTRGQDPVVAVSSTLNASMGKGKNGQDVGALVVDAYSTSGAGFWREGIGPLRGRAQDSHENICCVHGTQDPCVSDTTAFALGRNNGQENVVYALQHAQIGRKESAGPQGKGYQENIAFTQDGRPVADAIAHGIKVRRLTPVECERLQGFPDNYTLIPVKKANIKIKVDGDKIKLIDGVKMVMAADGPRYKALGNSWAVPNVRWIGQRIHNGIK